MGYQRSLLDSGVGGATDTAPVDEEGEEIRGSHGIASSMIGKNRLIDHMKDEASALLTSFAEAATATSRDGRS